MLCLAAALLGASTASGEEAACRLGKARYVQAESHYTIEFLPSPHDASTSLSNRFSVRGFEGGTVLSGEVRQANGYGGPWGEITRTCPNEASADSEPCTVWAGLIYVLGENTVRPLPRETELAPKTLLFPNFSWVIHGISLDKSHIPADVFHLEGCGP